MNYNGYHISKDTLKDIIKSQKNEITEFLLYSKLASTTKDQQNKKVLIEIAKDELRHYRFWKKISKKKLKPNNIKIFIYYWIAKIFGLTFGVKLMEKGEAKAQILYNHIAKEIPEVKEIAKEEDIHEKELLKLINEDRLKYVGSVVLGLNDALVELTGTLAGLTFALQKTKLIAIIGLITGIAASLSMASSEYLSTKSDGGSKHPIKSSLYTGVAYIITVFLLIIPYLLLDNYLLCLSITVLNAILIIIIFNFYISIAKDLPFKKRLTEMILISISVTIISFAIGYLIRLNIDL